VVQNAQNDCRSEIEHLVAASCTCHHLINEIVKYISGRALGSQPYEPGFEPQPQRLPILCTSPSAPRSKQEQVSL